MSKRTPPAQGPSLVPVFVAIVVILGAALAVAVMQKSEEGAAGNAPSGVDAADETPEGPNPFADIDNSPKGAAGTRPELVDTAPAGLAETAAYVEAKKTATEGVALVKEATAARDAGDEETFQRKGAVAKAKLDTAFEGVSSWLLEIQEAYPNDRQVARIEREIERWRKAHREVRMIR